MASDEGVDAVKAAARQARFALFGRTRSARRRLFRESWQRLSARSVRERVAAECERYVGAWTELAYAPSLPRHTVALRRLVVVPRAMILGRIGPGVITRVGACAGIAEAADAFKGFLARWILCDMEEAIRRAAPSPHRPVYARDSWACVALDRDFVWVDPLWSGPEWRGHVVMFEMPAGRLARRERRELEATIERLTGSLPNLTRQQRDSAVRAAAEEMRSLTISAR